MIGISGIEYYPPLQCSGSPTGDYVSKLTTHSIAKKEMDFSSIIKTYIPHGAVYAEYTCTYDKPFVKDLVYDTCIFFKRGTPISTYISDLVISYKNQSITPQKLKMASDILNALNELKEHVRSMNSKGFSHNAICPKNIVYNESSKKAYLIHFDHSIYSTSDDEDNINTIIQNLSDQIHRIKTDFY